MCPKEDVDSTLPPAEALRREAQRRLRDKNAAPVESMAEVDVRALLHELQVHQIELEMQNEDLRRTQAATQQVSDKYQDLFDFAPVGYFRLDEQGRILEINLAGAALLGLVRSTAVTQRLEPFVATGHRAIFADFCNRVLSTDAKQTCEIELRRGEDRQHALLEGIVSHDDAVNRSFFLAVADISQQRRAEKAMRDRDEEITDRKHAEGVLQELNATLDQHVARRTAELAQQTKQLRALAVELTQAEQRERRRLAQILHDQLQQLLVAARMKVGLLRRHVQEHQLLQTIREIDELLNEIINESRSLAVQLCPPVLYVSGLGAALEWLAHRTQEKFDLAIEVQVDPAAEPAKEAARVFLFQAAGELLLNAAKHARAHRVQLRMTRVGAPPSQPPAGQVPGPQGAEQVCIEVCDNGVGFDPGQVARKPGGGFGMFSIRQRLEVFGGHLEIHSSPGQGTQVTLWAPLGKKAEERL